MSTTSTPIVAATSVPQVHQSWWARAATWFSHEAKAIKNAIIGISNKEPAIAAAIQKIAPTVEGISEMLLPGSAAWEQHLIDVWSAVAPAVIAAGDAATANGINVQLDAKLVASVKAIAPAVAKFLHPDASPAPPPPSA